MVGGDTSPPGSPPMYITTAHSQTIQHSDKTDKTNKTNRQTNKQNKLGSGTGLNSDTSNTMRQEHGREGCYLIG